MLEIEDIDLSVCLVQDPMHILTEGLLVKELCLMLYDFIVFKRYFTISFLNNALNDFSYPYLEEKNKPEIISVDELLNCRLKQTSASVITLCCVLPLVLGQKVPVGNGKWKTFLLLIQITLLATSPYATDYTASVLEQLIYTHNDNFTSEYPKSPLTPKSHYLVHIPKQIQRFGPGRNYLVMRFEGKHLLFKNIKWKCFKNIALSLSMRHQLWMCWRQLGVNGKYSENFLYSGDSVADLQAVDIVHCHLVVKDFLRISNLHVSSLFTAKEVDIKGHRYKLGCVLALDYVDNCPTFGVVDQILVVANEKVFIVDQLDILGFDNHTLYYEVKRSNKISCFKYSDLRFVWPLSMQTYNGYTGFFCEIILKKKTRKNIEQVATQNVEMPIAIKVFV